MHGETRNWWELCALIVDSWSVHFPRRLVYNRRGKVTAQEAGVRHACFTVPRFLFSSWQCTPTCFSNCFAFLSCLSWFLFLSSSTYIYLPLMKESHFQRWESALVYTPPEWKHQVPKVNPLHRPLQELHKTQCKNIKKKKNNSLSSTCAMAIPYCLGPSGVVHNTNQLYVFIGIHSGTTPKMSIATFFSPQKNEAHTDSPLQIPTWVVEKKKKKSYRKQVGNKKDKILQE